MPLFRYSIYDNHNLLTFNYVNATTKEDALNSLEAYKEKLNGTYIKIKRVYSASEWSKECPKESG